MPPFADSKPSSYEFIQNKPDPSSNIVAIGVGGQLFRTTKQTLTLSAPKYLFPKISDSSDQYGVVPFIDKDPELFSILLSPQNWDSPFSLSTTPYGSVHVAHGSKITSFDWSLQRKSTIWTQFTTIDSLLALSPNVAAAGATDFSRLKVIDLEKDFVRERLTWENVTRSSSTVQAIGSSPQYLFTSFESVLDDLSSVFKVGLNSGKVFVADLRNISDENSLVCLGDARKLTNPKTDGFGCKIESRGNQVFCGKGGDLELWSEVLIGSSRNEKNGSDERVFKKKLMGRVTDVRGSRMTRLGFRGSKMFVTRNDQQFAEVWQSSVREF
ncbi:BTB/POZ domain-containing protein [Actinidia chinensis var. chinensis]|uniref:BTB/POZ domain-containing protein n=1 Tax=Actinidia chinensis var. chinensis TaxID=1590841 RepID=A0A2R6PHZ4_ACTCC|nr:BTB/POZ domain-containing protein [Actinidia chinensis var. chinensis]